MTATAILENLRARGVSIRADGGEIVCGALPGTITPDLIETMRALKPDILSLLSAPAGMPLAASGNLERYQTKWAGLPLLVLDCATCSDKCDNLKKLKIVEYAFAPDSALHGIAVRYPDRTTEFHSHAQVLITELQEEYGEHLEDAAVVFHHGYLNYFILHHRFGLRLDNIVDTMLLARLTHGPTVAAELKELAIQYELPPRGNFDFMKGIRSPTAEQITRLCEYAKKDTQITGALAEILAPPVFSRMPIELSVIEHSIRQFVEKSLVIDTAAVDATSVILEKNISEIIEATGHSREEISGTKSFPALLGAALSKSGRSLPMKEGKVGLILALSKKDPQQELLLTDDDDVVRRLVEAWVRLGTAPDARSKLQYLKHGAALMAGRCSFLHNYHAAVTGRFAGGGGFNIQNLKDPDRAEESDVTSGPIRSAIRAESGCSFVSADAAQIEARILGLMAGQEDLHGALARGVDVYSEFASAQFHREVRKPRADDPPDTARSLELLRQVGKGAILGLGYKMGAKTFICRLKQNPLLRSLFRDDVLNERTCCAIIGAYRQRYPAIVSYWAKCDEAFRRALCGVTGDVGGIRFERNRDTNEVRIRLPSGRDLVYPRAREEPATFEQSRCLDVHGVWQTRTDDRPSLAYADDTKLYGGKIVENIIQAVARDLLVDVICRLEAHRWNVVHHCHDSITVMVDQRRKSECAAAMVEAWRAVPSWMSALVMDAEAEAGPSLGEMHKVKLAPAGGTLEQATALHIGENDRAPHQATLSQEGHI